MAIEFRWPLLFTGGEVEGRGWGVVGKGVRTYVLLHIFAGRAGLEAWGATITRSDQRRDRWRDGRLNWGGSFLLRCCFCCGHVSTYDQLNTLYAWRSPSPSDRSMVDEERVELELELEVFVGRVFGGDLEEEAEYFWVNWVEKARSARPGNE